MWFLYLSEGSIIPCSDFLQAARVSSPSPAHLLTPYPFAYQRLCTPQRPTFSCGVISNYQQMSDSLFLFGKRSEGPSLLCRGVLYAKSFRPETAIIKNTVRLLYESKYRVQRWHNTGAAQGGPERGPETCLKLHG